MEKEVKKIENDDDFMDFGKTDVDGIGKKIKVYEKLFNDGDISEERFNVILKEIQTGKREI